MNGHDTLFENPNYDPDKQYDEDGNEIEEENEEDRYVFN